MKFTTSFTAAALAHLACALPCATVTEYVDAVVSQTAAPSSIVSSSAVEIAPASSSAIESSVKSAPASSSVVASSSVAAVERPATTTGPVGYASLNGGTTGGEGGSTTTVSSFSEFTAAAEAEGAAVIYISGSISGDEQVRPTSDKSIIGLSGATLEGVGLYIKEVSNVIVQNLIIKDVIDDAVSIDQATNVWVDHLDLSSDLDSGKDYYDGLVDVTHAADYITISNCYFHDHYKASLIGHSDSNGDEDTGHLRVTYANNHWKNINSRQPSIRFGTAHIFNSVYEGGASAVNTRMGAQVLVESTVFSDIDEPVRSVDSDEDGYAVLRNNDYGSGSPTAEEGTLTSVPYEHTALDVAEVEAAVVGVAGATL